MRAPVRPTFMSALVAAGAGALALAAALAPAPASAQRLDSAALDGLEFRQIGPANMSGRVVDIAVNEKNPAVFYVAAATGGLWKTTSAGVTFRPVFNRQATISIGDVALSQADTNVVWVGTGERANRQSNSWGDGVYRSTDGGKSWTNMGLKETREIGRIAVDPTNPDVVYVAAIGHLWGPNEERGLYRTKDGGQTWEKVLYVDENTGVVDVAVDPEQPNVLYAASYQRRRRAFGFHGGGPGSALWKSTDGGDHWKKLENGLPGGEYGRIGISIYRKDPRIVYVSVEKGYRFNASTAYVAPAEDAGIFRSEDRGETWQHMGTWNPRPMYASQPLVDPNDDCRIFMENEFSVSTDCGKTFEPVRTRLHGDDRFLWIDPSDSRHMIHADDGGVGITWDDGRTWLYQTALPISQWYHVRVDDAVPYNVYGGLQDNGCWTGPSATYRNEGILNEDWERLCGGDGFLVVPDTAAGGAVYAESQYLGLARIDTVTWDSRDIRPGDPHGAIGPRRNFDAWFAGEEQPALLNAMAPANWDGPYVISPHDHNTLYAGTNHLWKSTDRGSTWTDLGDMTTGTDRRKLAIMGQSIGDSVPSIDDGIPYWPTISAIAESPVRAGVLWVGTDDGRLRLSRDGGRTFADVQGAIPGFPTDTPWISMVEPSRKAAGTAYAVVHNYRNDDYANYLWRTTDFGKTWTDLTSDLPAERVLRAVREDPRNPDVLWLGTELGLFVSVDAGKHWTAFRANLPTVPVNDLVVHERDDDLVLATHGRGVWILDDAMPVQELTPAVLASDAHLFSAGHARTIRYSGGKAHEGAMAFHGENPPDGAMISYWLKEKPDSGDVAVAVLDASGSRVADVDPSLRAGMNRAVWNLRYADLPSGGRRGMPGPVVAPGTYTVRLTVDGHSMETPVRVLDDPRSTLTAAQRAQWTADLRRIAQGYTDAHQLVEALAPAVKADSAGTADLAALVDELQSRWRGLYFAVSSWPGPLTADQRSQLAYYAKTLDELRPRVRQATGG